MRTLRHRMEDSWTIPGLRILIIAIRIRPQPDLAYETVYDIPSPTWCELAPNSKLLG